MKKSEKGVTHWVDGFNSWQLGLSGFFLRLRGFLLSLPLAGVPFWWPSKWPASVEIPTTSFMLYGFALSMTTVVGIVFYVRHRVKRSLQIKSLLHSFTHEARDGIQAILERTQPKPGRPAKNDLLHERSHLLKFSDSIAETIAAYVRLFTGDSTAGCSIRLAQDVPGDGKDEIVYVTVGRSGNLNKNRAKTSEPIGRNEGIPKFFLGDSQACHGLLFYDDVKLAASHDLYKRTKNDAEFENDYSSMIVAPLNGWNGFNSDLIGLLCFTSKTSRLLQPKQVDLFKFTADHLASCYMSMINSLQRVGRMPDLTLSKEENA